jgi:hypothetical protein
MVWEKGHTTAICLLREQGGTTPGIRDLIPAWSVVRQLRSKPTRSLWGIECRRDRYTAQKWPELCMTPSYCGGIIVAYRAAVESVPGVEGARSVSVQTGDPALARGCVVVQLEMGQEFTTRTPRVGASLHTWCSEEGRRMYATSRSGGPRGGPSNE